METITKRKKHKLTSDKHVGKDAVFAAIRQWRNTSGKKLSRWDEIKTIRLLREQAK